MITVLNASGKRCCLIASLACLSALLSLCWTVTGGSTLVATTARTIHKSASRLAHDRVHRDHAQVLACVKHADFNSTEHLRFCVDMVRTSAYLASSDFASKRADARDWFKREPAHMHGVLIVAGGRAMLLSAAVNIMVMRTHLKSQLPIEVVYYGAKEYDDQAVAIIKGLHSPAAPVDVLDGLSANFTSRTPHYHPQAPISGYATKVHALCYVTRFRHVLYLDSDALPVLQPEKFFELRQYAAHGNLFWPDNFVQHIMQPNFYLRHGIRPPWELDASFLSTESGQIVLDRLRHMDVLEWLWFLNSHTAITYAESFGDKDTFRLAFAITSKVHAFQQASERPRLLLSGKQDGGVTYLHQALLQGLEPDVPAFIHRAGQGKWFPYCNNTPSVERCQPEWITPPLLDGQAGTLWSNQPHGFTAQQADVNLHHDRCCQRAAECHSPHAQLHGTHRRLRMQSKNGMRPAWAECHFGDAAKQLPAPLVPIAYAGSEVIEVLDASGVAFQHVQSLAHGTFSSRN